MPKDHRIVQRDAHCWPCPITAGHAGNEARILNDPALSIETFVDESFGENAYVIHTLNERGTPVGWVIDPGFPPQVDQLLGYISGREITIEKIILTHGHADHIAGLDAVHSSHPDAPVLMPAAEQRLLSDPYENLSAPFGMSVTVQSHADQDLAPGTELLLARFGWQVLDTSGHSPAGRSLYCAQAGVVIAGDALFAGSIGRTDFPGCDPGRLIVNIREKLLTLPDETIVYAGHGPPTTVGNERKSNPFVADA